MVFLSLGSNVPRGMGQTKPLVRKDEENSGRGCQFTGPGNCRPDIPRGIEKAKEM